MVTNLPIEFPREALFAPEFEILTAVTGNRLINRFRGYALNRYLRDSGMEPHNGNEGDSNAKRITISFGLDSELELMRDNVNLDTVMRQYDLLLCSGTLSETTKQNLKDAITQNSTVWWQNDERLETLILSIVTSPDCAVAN